PVQASECARAAAAAERKYGSTSEDSSNDLGGPTRLMVNQSTHKWPDLSSILFNPDHLRSAADHLVLLHRFQRAIDRIFMRRIGNQDHGHLRGFSALRRFSVGVTLHDGFDGNLLFREPG